MIFEQEYPIFEILDVLKLEQENKKTYNFGRNFDALSFRYEADTVIETQNETLQLSDGAVCYVPADVNYKRTTKKDKLIVVHLKLFHCCAHEVECCTPKNTEKYQKLFAELLRRWEKKEIAYQSECSALVYRIFAELCRDNRRTDGGKQSKIKEAVAYLNQNCKRADFSIEEAAKQSFMSEVYFRKLFKAEFGQTPKQYIIERRLNYAKALLLAGYYSVAEAAALCGYRDSKHFSVEFKKHTGISPHRFSYCFDKKGLS